MEFIRGTLFLDLICEFLIKSSLILGVSLFFVFLLRKKSATMKHFLLSFSLISLLVFPFLSSITTGWETKWLPSWQIAQKSSRYLDERNKNGEPLLNLNQGQDEGQADNIRQSRYEKAAHRNKKPDFFKTTDIKFFLGLSLVTIWTAGLIFLLFRILLGLYGAHRLTRQGRRISGAFWQLLVQHFLNAVSIRRKISLLSHDKVNVPLTWGVIKPVVIMPAKARNWNRDQCSSALFHELSHIKRSDFLVKVLARLSCSLYWFNPLSWVVFGLMRKEQEKACDELVLKAGVKPSTYAAHLLSIQKAGQIQWNPPITVLGAVGKSQLNERVLAILKRQLKTKEVKMKTKVLLSFFIIAVVAFIGLARPSQSVASAEIVMSDSDTSMTEIQNPPQPEGVQEEQEKKETKKAEKEKSADEKDKELKKTGTSKEEKPAKVSVCIDKDDKTKRIIFSGKPCVLVKREYPGKGFVLSISGKDFELKRGESGHWTIEADKIHVINEDEAKVIKLDKDNTVSITIEKGKDGKNIHILKSPEIHIKKALKTPLCYSIHIGGGKGEKKALCLSPHLDVLALPHLEVLPLMHMKTEHKKLRDKLEKLRERLKKTREIEDEAEKDEAQKEALKDIEKALDELSEELEKGIGKHKDLDLRINSQIKHKLLDKMKCIKKIKEHLPCIEIGGDKEIISLVDEDEGWQIIIKGKLDSKNKDEYEETIKRLRESLPENYKVESKIDEKNSTITISITPEKKDDKSKEEVKKLVKEFVEELSEIEKSTS